MKRKAADEGEVEVVECSGSEKEMAVAGANDKPRKRAKPDEKAGATATSSNCEQAASNNIFGQMSEVPSFARRPWPCPFVLPDFPPHVQNELEKKHYASKKVRLQIIRILYDHILQFTTHPSRDQRREVCIALVNKYPGQQGSTGGYDSWMNFLTNKFKNETYHLGPKEKTREAERTMGKSKSRVKKELQRGIVHWQPPPKCGENEQSHKIHKSWLQKESKRPEKDRDAIKERMELTYSFRRVFINEEKRPIKEIMREYPCLFDEEEICNEFARLMADDNMLQRRINRLLQLSPKILNYSKSKGNSPTIKKYLGYLDQGVEDLVDDEVPDLTDGCAN